MSRSTRAIPSSTRRSALPSVARGRVHRRSSRWRTSFCSAATYSAGCGSGWPGGGGASAGRSVTVTRAVDLVLVTGPERDRLEPPVGVGAGRPAPRAKPVLRRPADAGVAPLDAHGGVGDRPAVGVHDPAAEARGVRLRHDELDRLL